MSRTLTKKQASKRLSVVPEQHLELGYLSLYRNETMIETAYEAIQIGLAVLKSSNQDPHRRSPGQSPN